ncbi:MAG TPA: winged helix DNA-binding domain-containing protein [Actinomycetota bacterium]|nr:winged helix DNA-binding domain-containing protein [Actinomycetota bacterium]
MSGKVLTIRDLNRTTLHRQMLLARTPGTVTDAVSRLAGLQAQNAMAPFVGLWTRLDGFGRQDLLQALQDRTVVKATMMRGTLHLTTAEDYLDFRGTLQPLLTAASESISRGRAGQLNVPALVAAAREFLEDSHRSFAEISTHLAGLHPGTDVGAMRYAVRTHLPLVQVPVPRAWGYPGNPKFALAEDWLGRSIPAGKELPALIRRYLAAFGPASVTDMQAWSGFTNLKQMVETLRRELTVYRDENRRELFDLPGLPLVDPDTPAPERFLPEYDNLLLSHAKRTRVLAGEHRPKVYVPVLRVRSTFLVDGFVAGTWRVEKAGGVATLLVEPFSVLPKASRRELETEGEKLVRFAGYDSKSHEVRFAD